MLESGAEGRAAVPSGASTGTHEAVERRDGGGRFGGKGVQDAVRAVNEEIFPALSGMESSEQARIDVTLNALDGTENKGRLGANAILGVSLAAARASAVELDQPLFRYVGGLDARLLPVPMMNVLNGGAHADNAIDVQEFMVMPVAAGSVAEAIRVGSRNLSRLGKAALRRRPCHQRRRRGRLRAGAGEHRRRPRPPDEGHRGGGLPARRGCLSRARRGGERVLPGRRLPARGRGPHPGCRRHDRLLRGPGGRYPIASIEDGLAEDDWAGWAALTQALGARIRLVGDDLFVTDAARLGRGIAEGAANAILVKVNQVGTLTETLETVSLALRSGFGAVMSHRSGETEDTTIADLAVATGCGQIKAGAPSRTDRTAKYNQLIRIEEALDDTARYAGRAVLRSS